MGARKAAVEKAKIPTEIVEAILASIIEAVTSTDAQTKIDKPKTTADASLVNSSQSEKQTRSPTVPEQPTSVTVVAPVKEQPPSQPAIQHPDDKHPLFISVRQRIETEIEMEGGADYKYACMTVSNRPDRLPCKASAKTPTPIDMGQSKFAILKETRTGESFLFFHLAGEQAFGLTRRQSDIAKSVISIEQLQKSQKTMSLNDAGLVVSMNRMLPGMVYID